jgi:antitoxin ParD1/3/4
MKNTRPAPDLLLTESNNSWLNSHVENIGDYANKSELINDLIRRARRAEFINQKLSKAEKSNFISQSPDEILAEFKADLIK